MDMKAKKYNEMKSDYKKADKLYAEMKGGKGSACMSPAENPNYNYKAGINDGIRVALKTMETKKK